MGYKMRARHRNHFSLPPPAKQLFQAPAHVVGGSGADQEDRGLMLLAGSDASGAQKVSNFTTTLLEKLERPNPSLRLLRNFIRRVHETTLGFLFLFKTQQAF